MADASWRTDVFRQSVVTKIDEAIKQSKMNISRNSTEMENNIFQEAKSKEEYLGFVSGLILHIRNKIASCNLAPSDGAQISLMKTGAPSRIINIFPNPSSALDTPGPSS